MNKANHPIEEYWKNRNVNVTYNALGGGDDLINSYVTTFDDDVKRTKSKTSNDIKKICYGKLFPLENLDRKKYTGFENVATEDREFRTKVGSLLVRHELTSWYLHTPEITAMHYKDVLINRVKEFSGCYLYLSGGLDSELVAMAMLEAGIEFTPVIFNITNGGEQSKNIHDVKYAYQFCNKHGLYPIIESMDITAVWDSKEFQEMAIELGISSPQITSHCYFVNIINSKYGAKQHVFGGEVRFYTTDVDGVDTNFVQLVKVDPVGYNGVAYEHSILFTVTTVSIALRYSSISGDWSVLGMPGSLTYDSGQWTTTPATSYEYRITSISASSLPSPSAGTFQPSAAEVPTSWSTISGLVEVCKVLVTPISPGSSASGTYGIEVRKVGTTTPLVTSTIILTALWEA